MGRSTLPGKREEARRAGMTATIFMGGSSGRGRNRTSSASSSGTRNIQVHDDRFLSTANNDGFDRLILPGVQLLMGRKGRHIHKISRAGLVDKLQLLSPAETGASTHDVDYGFQLSVVMRAGFRVGMDDYSACPKFLRAHSSIGNGLGAGHARSLRSIAVELAAAHNTQAEGYCWGFGIRHERRRESLMLV